MKYKNGHFYIEKVSASKIAKKYSTPTYVYSFEKIVSNIEKFIIESLLELGIKAYKKNNIVGIWTLDLEKKEAKIGSLGLRVSKGIIYHGLSLNVSCDLSNFYKINPCGIKGSRVTSVKNLKNLINKNEVYKVLKRKVKILFN